MDVFHLWRILRPRLRFIGSLTVGASLAVFFISRFLLTPWYRAEALLRPASQEIVGSAGLYQVLGSGGAATGLLGSTPNDANEQMTMLTSYDFAVWVLSRYRLEPMLTLQGDGWLGWPKSGPQARRPDSWTLYRTLRRRFEVAYDSEKGNLNLAFVDPDAAHAKRILEAYISGLREQLQKRAVESADSSIKSLEEEVRRTSDVLLISQLDQLIAAQLQNRTTAEVQANFAFTVISGPVVPNIPYQPRPLLYGGIAGTTCFALLCMMFLVSGSSQRERAISRAKPVGRAMAIQSEKK